MNFLSEEKGGCYLPEEVGFHVDHVLLREAFLIQAVFREALNADIQVLLPP